MWKIMRRLFKRPPKINQFYELNDFDFLFYKSYYYPSKKTLLNVHDFLIEKFLDIGGEVHKGILSDANLEHCLNHVMYHVKNKKNKKETLIIKGAHIFNLLVCGHCFVDGNKRIGFVGLVLFLSANDLKLNFSKMEYEANYNFIKSIAMRKANDKRNIPEIINWIKYNLESKK